MKTSKEMQLKIIDKMRENVESGSGLLEGIQYRNRVNLLWDDRVHDIGTAQFERLEMRVKPETITINGVEIQKPLKHDDISPGHTYYFPQCHDEMYGELMGVSIRKYNVWYVYATKDEAIEASKLLFGIED